MNSPEQPPQLPPDSSPSAVEPAQPQYAAPPPQGAGTNGYAIASLVLGISGFVVCPIVASVVAIVFGVIAKRQIDANPGTQGRGMAQAGFILGIVGIAVWVVGIIAYIVLVAVIVGVGEGISNDPNFNNPDYYNESLSFMLTPLLNS